jgi:hypothetical protein
MTGRKAAEPVAATSAAWPTQPSNMAKFAPVLFIVHDKDGELARWRIFASAPNGSDHVCNSYAKSLSITNQHRRRLAT